MTQVFFIDIGELLTDHEISANHWSLSSRKVCLTDINFVVFTLSVFIDLSKAFGTIDHHIFLKKLKHGISGITLAWFKSYLHKRKQYISVDENLKHFQKYNIWHFPRIYTWPTFIFNLCKQLSWSFRYFNRDDCWWYYFIYIS